MDVIELIGAIALTITLFLSLITWLTSRLSPIERRMLQALPANKRPMHPMDAIDVANGKGSRKITPREGVRALHKLSDRGDTETVPDDNGGASHFCITDRGLKRRG